MSGGDPVLVAGDGKKMNHKVTPSLVLLEMKSAVLSPTGRVSVGPAFSVKGTYWGVQVFEGRKKIGPFLVAPEDDNSPAGALRSLANMLEVLG